MVNGLHSLDHAIQIQTIKVSGDQKGATSRRPDVLSSGKITKIQTKVVK